MPTLRYEIDSICSNCFNQQKLSIPRGCQFVPHEGHQKSGYMKYKTGHKVRQSCDNCGCDTLGIDPSKMMPEHLLQLFITMGGVNNEKA